MTSNPPQPRTRLTWLRGLDKGPDGQGQGRFLAVTAIAALAVIAVSVVGATITDTADDFPSWLEATSTATALLAAIFAARYAARAFAIEAYRESRYAREHREQQAVLVAAWAEVASMEAFQNGATRTVATGVRAFVRNASKLPVQDVGLSLILRVDGDRVFTAILTPPDLQVVPPNDEPVVVPVTDENITRRVQQLWDAHGREAVDVRVRIDFTDTRGLRWERGHNGRLAEILRLE